MGAAAEIVMCQDTAPGATVTAMVAQTPGSLTIRNTMPQADIRLLNWWGYQNVVGIQRLHSPRMHDNVQGIRVQVNALQATPLIPSLPLQKLYPQDALILENTGSGVAGNIETGFFIVYYSDLPGIAARFIDPVALMQRGVNLVGVEIDTTPGVAGGWSGAQPLNHSFDNFKANIDYAVLGATFSATTGTGAWAISGPDTGNLYIGGPGQTAQYQLGDEWFVRLSRLTGIPLIPVINAANKAGTNLYIGSNQAGTAVNVSLTLVELAPMGQASPTARPAGA